MITHDRDHMAIAIERSDVIAVIFAIAAGLAIGAVSYAAMTDHIAAHINARLDDQISSD
ncbi:hypothetical protein [Celeribacter sp.]|uniref:hypothetical protein n=1 Tax=Celeribacter sp. TaxID=1890673 RepID=UPI003A8E4267